jgi:hypothetical protein
MIRKKLVRRILEEHDKVLRSYFAQKGGTLMMMMSFICKARGGTEGTARAGNVSNGTCMCEEGVRGPWPNDQILNK